MTVFDEAWVACVLRGVSPRSEHAASRVGVHNGDAGRVAHPTLGRRSENTCRKKSREEIGPIGSKCAKTLTGQDFSEISPEISKSRPRAGATARSGRIRVASRCRRGGDTPQRRNREEMWSGTGVGSGPFCFFFPDFMLIFFKEHMLLFFSVI